MEGKYFLITGASSGIGKSTVELLSKQGARCVLVARDTEKLNTVCAGLDVPQNHIVIPYDLKDLNHYDEIFSQLKEKGIMLSGMVHCAGITRVTPLRTITTTQIMELFALHYYAFIELVKWYAKKGVAKEGSIVGVSSINAHVPQKCMTAYASAKAAVECACRTLAVELNEKRIRINSVVVGGISGGMGSDIHDASESARMLLGNSNKLSYENPVNRQLLGTGMPSQIADAIVFLLSRQSSFITGRELYVDGGLL